MTKTSKQVLLCNLGLMLFVLMKPVLTRFYGPEILPPYDLYISTGFVFALLPMVMVVIMSDSLNGVGKFYYLLAAVVFLMVVTALSIYLFWVLWIGLGLRI